MSMKDLEGLVNRVLEGDCLELLKKLPDKSVQLILCDLPYGTTRNKWDSIIDLDKLWEQYSRIIKDDGAVVLTAQGMFTAKLMLSNPRDFRYKITWVKSKSTNFLNVKKQPLRKHEDICVFYKRQTKYFPQMQEGASYDKGIRKSQLTGSYGLFSPVHVKSDGMRYPSDVIYFKTAESEGEVFHPTQKPVELGQYLVKTYTEPGDIVLDNASGSGSFLVAAKMEGRQFIGMELNKEVILHHDKPMDMIEITNRRLSNLDMKITDHVNLLTTVPSYLGGMQSAAD